MPLPKRRPSSVDLALRVKNPFYQISTGPSMPTKMVNLTQAIKQASTAPRIRPQVRSNITPIGLFGLGTKEHRLLPQVRGGVQEFSTDFYPHQVSQDTMSGDVLQDVVVESQRPDLSGVSSKSREISEYKQEVVDLLPKFQTFSGKVVTSDTTPYTVGHALGKVGFDVPQYDFVGFEGRKFKRKIDPQLEAGYIEGRKEWKHTSEYRDWMNRVSPAEHIPVVENVVSPVNEIYSQLSDIFSGAGDYIVPFMPVEDPQMDFIYDQRQLQYAEYLYDEEFYQGYYGYY